MPTWTCPNTKCTYDQELQSGRSCPLCGRDAEAFEFGELGDLLREKWSSKKSEETNKGIKQVIDRTKYCPTCGSANIFWASGLPQLWSLWECRECGYKGALVFEDSELAARLRDEWGRKHRER